jgi:hypothetical protein
MKFYILLTLIICSTFVEARARTKNGIENCENGAEYMVLLKPYCGKCKDGHVLELLDETPKCIPQADSKCKDLECSVCEAVGCTSCRGTGKIAFNNLCMEGTPDTKPHCMEHCGACAPEKPEMCFACRYGFSMEVNPETKAAKCIKAPIDNCAVHNRANGCELCHNGFVKNGDKCVPVQGKKKQKK